MKKEIIRKIISHLRNEGLLSEVDFVTEDEFLEKLYINNDERKEILKALISLFSEEYRNDLKRAVILDNDLSHKMQELEFVTKEKGLHFIMGKCSKEEQEAVYEKMFKALHFALIAQEHDCNKFPSPMLTENLSKQGIQLTANKIKKHSKKKFNLEQANKNLEMVWKTLVDTSELMDKGKTLSAKTSPHKLDVVQNEASKLSEVSNTAESFRLTMEKRIPLSSTCSTERQTGERLSAELGLAVGELHSVLQFVADATKSSSSEGLDLKKKIDLEKMVEQANQLDINSVLSKCFHR